jgi:hypothetical protein
MLKARTKLVNINRRSNGFDKNFKTHSLQFGEWYEHAVPVGKDGSDADRNNNPSFVKISTDCGAFPLSFAL